MEFLFENCYKISGNRDALITSSLNLLYPKIVGCRLSLFPSVLPSNFKNVKTKVTNFLKKHPDDRYDKFPDFYKSIDEKSYIVPSLLFREKF